MFPARTVSDAAYDAFEVYRNDPWDRSEDAIPFEQIYVATRPGREAVRIAIYERFLQARRASKIFFTGQVGSGKSSD